MSTINRPILNHITQQLGEVHHGKLWMGNTFAKKLATLSEEQAFVRPSPTLHSAAELLAYLTAWRKDALRQQQLARKPGLLQYQTHL